MDGPAAAPEGARHLLPLEAPRPQAALQQRPAALLRLRHACGGALRTAGAAAAAAGAAIGASGARGLHVLRATPQLQGHAAIACDTAAVSRFAYGTCRNSL